MSTVRTVALWESAYDLKRLSANGLNFCIAKSVIASDGTESFNLVWQSKGLAPRSTIQWTVEYGLNWTLEIPSVDAQVTIGGAWQACSPGQVYDIDSVGLFQSSSVPPQPNALKIGKNGYHYPGTSGIHILVGVRIPGGAENDFEPVSHTCAMNLFAALYNASQTNACSPLWINNGPTTVLLTSASMLISLRFMSTRLTLDLACQRGINLRRKLNGGMRRTSNQRPWLQALSLIFVHMISLIQIQPPISTTSQPPTSMILGCGIRLPIRHPP